MAAVRDLPTYLAIMNGFYSLPRSGLERLPPPWRSALDPDAVARTLDAHPYLRRFEKFLTDIVPSARNR